MKDLDDFNEEFVIINEAFTSLGAKYIIPREETNVILVGKMLEQYDVGEACYGKEIDHSDFFKYSFQNFSLLGTEVTSHALSLINGNFSFSSSAEKFSDSVRILYRVNRDKDGNVFYTKDGNSASITFPSSHNMIDTVTAPHEFVHFLKDTNIFEYRDYYLVEVLPIFIELLCFEKERPFALELLKDRVNWLKDAYLYYLEFYEYDRLYSKNEKNHVNKYIKSLHGAYLNGFYYAVLLLREYRKNPKRVLEFVNKVLYHDCTTLDLINSVSRNFRNNCNGFLEETDRILKLVK